ncbi:MAG: hypothetical protein VW683_00180 [Betaproteobacteria bacterium]|jgi:hypothetical protein
MSLYQNYIHNLDRIFSKEEIENYFRPGWRNLIDRAYKLISMVDGVEIAGAKRHKGMFHCYVKSDDEFALNIGEGIAWKMERLSTQMCEECGKRGTRRLELKKIYCFCNTCYALYLDRFESPLDLMWPSKRGKF